MKRDLSKGLGTEYMVIDELKRRKIPLRHRVNLDYYEVDILVGKRIIIEVDGYVHLTKESIEKDRRKEEHFRELGYIVLRITGNQVRNRGFLRDFGRKVKELYESETDQGITGSAKTLTQSLAGEELKNLKKALVIKEKDKSKHTKSTPKDSQSSGKKEEKSDRDLFLEWIDKEIPPEKE